MEARETIEKYGAQFVSDEDLLTIIIDDNGRTKKLMESLISDYEAGNNPLQKVAYENYAQLKFRGKLTSKQAVRLAAAIELGKRLTCSSVNGQIYAREPQTVADYIGPMLRCETQEHFLVISVNAKNRVIKIKDLFKGGLSGTSVDVKQVFNEAIVEHAVSILIAHNHPSGDPHPSNEDKMLTKSILEAGKVLGIPLLDHIIIGGQGYFSFAENGNIDGGCYKD